MITERQAQITLPELALIAGTRALLGGGIGLLLADRMPMETRRAVGWTLFIVGTITTIPLALEVFGRSQVSRATAEIPSTEASSKAVA